MPSLVELELKGEGGGTSRPSNLLDPTSVSLPWELTRRTRRGRAAGSCMANEGCGMNGIGGGVVVVEMAVMAEVDRCCRNGWLLLGGGGACVDPGYT